MSTKNPSTPRVAAIIGPYLSGKTSLLESILVVTGVVHRKGNIRDGSTLGDSSKEARDRGMGTEVNIVSTEYLGEQWTFLDCPGSVELSQDSINAMAIADIAIVVAEPEPEKSVTISPVLKTLNANGIPHIVFINKMDLSETSVRNTLEALQEISAKPLVLREIPIREGEAVVGHVDLVSERAFRWQEGKPSELIQLPDGEIDREQGARTEMLESLADFDDTLLEELLEDITPSTDEVYTNLTRDLQGNLIVPVFFGSAENDNGVVRLLKALRHETGEIGGVADRLGIETNGTSAQVFKTIHAGQIGKLSLARIMDGTITDGMNLNGERVSGVYHMGGQKTHKLGTASAGDIVALGRMDSVHTGDLLTVQGDQRCDLWPAPLAPLFSMSVHAADRVDEVKLSSNLHKVADEDTSVSFGHDLDTGEMLLWGQGEIHLNIVLARLSNRFNLTITSARPRVPYKETIQKPTSQHSRHKKQSGGHGEFGDVHIDIRPLPRGSGFDFSDTVTGGAVPKQYIPAVETGVKEYLPRGPLGFSVVDIAVTLTDGQHHAVDSSEMAFKKAAQQAMREGMPNCGPVLLEPICLVTISMPDEFTSNIQRLVSGRRGHILGFDAKDGWVGWDEVQAHIPQVEMHDMIIELRSMTQGVGTFAWKFDHLQELSGKLADNVVSARQSDSR